MGNEKTAEINGKLKIKKARNPWKKIMPGACNTMVISPDHSSARIIHHQQPYFQYQLILNDLKSEPNFMCTKF